jgi:hypothetical protein
VQKDESNKYKTSDKLKINGMINQIASAYQMLLPVL